MKTICGLASIKGAAEFLGVREDTVKKWRQGVNDPRDGVLNDLSDLFERIEQVADVIIEQVDALEPAPGEEIQVAVTTAEGWPQNAALMALARAQLVLGMTVRLRLVEDADSTAKARLLRLPPMGSA